MRAGNESILNVAREKKRAVLTVVFLQGLRCYCTAPRLDVERNGLRLMSWLFNGKYTVWPPLKGQAGETLSKLVCGRRPCPLQGD